MKYIGSETETDMLICETSIKCIHPFAYSNKKTIFAKIRQHLFYSSRA